MYFSIQLVCEDRLIMGGKGADNGGLHNGLGKSQGNTL